MRDFREILKVKGQCEEAEEAHRESTSPASSSGGAPNLENLLDQYIEENDLK